MKHIKSVLRNLYGTVYLYTNKKQRLEPLLNLRFVRVCKPAGNDNPADLRCALGQSGTAVKPDMIINVAISGSVQYQVGMQNSKCIVSINHNAASPIFDISHYGAVADFKAVLPAVIEEIKNRRA